MGYYEMNQQRKQEIEDGLLALLRDTPYEEVTITDLTRQLHLARKTFYSYFHNKLECLESLTDRLILECDLRLLQTLPENAGKFESFVERLRYWTEHRAFLEIIIRDRLESLLLKRHLLHIQSLNPISFTAPLREDERYDEDVLYFYLSGQLYLLLKWCGEGFPLTPEEMARKIMRQIHDPMLMRRDQRMK